MKTSLSVLLITAASSLLGACAGTSEPPPQPVVFVLPAEQVDPGDEMLHAAVQKYLAQNNKPLSSHYSFVRTDLNNDGLRDGLVFFDLPHTYWCGWGGCTMAVFQASAESFTHLSDTAQIRGAVAVGETETNGWKDLGTRLSGLGVSDHNVLLRFDGAGYPQNAAGQEPLPYNLAQFGQAQLLP